jgi:hypothetical protein
MQHRISPYPGIGSVMNSALRLFHNSEHAWIPATRIFIKLLILSGSGTVSVAVGLSGGRAVRGADKTAEAFFILVLRLRRSITSVTCRRPSNLR